jgi:hypothetical protein
MDLHNIDPLRMAVELPRPVVQGARLLLVQQLLHFRGRIWKKIEN